MAFFDEAIPMLRVLINDLGATLTYSDARLEELLCVAAKILLSESINFSYDYTVTISTHTISPDPIVNGDSAFFNFIVLKAACIADISTYRTKSAVSGLVAKMGPASLDTKDYVTAFLNILNTEGGPCKAFERLKMEYSFGNANICRVILSPFVSNDFDPQSLSFYDNGSRDKILE